MKTPLSAAAVAAKWQSKVSASAQAYTDGVNAVTVNPAQLAAQAKDRWLAGIQAAAAAGKFENGLAKVSLTDWKTASVQKGAQALAASAKLGAIKVQAAETKWGPIRQQIVSSLAPRGTLEQNIQRAADMARGMANAAKNG